MPPIEPLQPTAPLSGGPIVLHVIESFGAGSAGAMQEFVDATPECTHHLLRAVREGEFIAGDTTKRFSRVLELPSGTAARIRAIRTAVRELRPDVVHAHSSFAGLYVRVALKTRRDRRTVYSPHCFAFERLDLPLPARVLVAVAEWVLAINTDVIAACSYRERRLAARLPTRRRPVYVPNTPRAAGSPDVRSPTAGPIAVSIGRLGPQKDPARFADAVLRTRATLPGLRAVWVGDGDEALRARLTGSGVHVTGWVPSAEVAQTLAGADVYVHTASWEGFPLAVLEAVTAGLPVVAHRIGAFEGMPERWLFDDGEEAARAITAALAEQESNVAEWRRALAENTPERQRAALRAVYSP